MCLAVEKLHGAERFWFLDPGRTIPGKPDKHPVQVVVTQSRSPLFNFLVPMQAEGLKVSPIRRTCKRVLDGFLWPPVPLYTRPRKSLKPGGSCTIDPKAITSPLVPLLQQSCRSPASPCRAIVITRCLLHRTMPRLLHGFWQRNATIGGLGKIP